MDRRSWLLMLLLASFWGASYMFIEIGLRDLSPSVVAFARIALAFAVLAPIAWQQGAFLGLRGRSRWLVLTAAAQVAGPFLLIAAGQQEIASSLAGILVSSAAIFTVVLAIWFDHEERATGLRLAGVFLGFAGVVVLFGLDLSASWWAALGGAAVLLASLGYAVGGLLIKHRFSDVAPLGLVTAVMFWSAILLLPAAVLSAPSEAPDLGPIAAIATLGVVGTGISFVIFYWLIAHVGPAKTMLVSYIAPGFAVVYGATLLGEDITVGTILGLVLILLGSWLGAEGRLPGRMPHEDEPPPAEVDPAAGAAAPVGAQPEAAIRRSHGAAR
jgi:drug/metabolite transporter (DMT)-like permease